MPRRSPHRLACLLIALEGGVAASQAQAQETLLAARTDVAGARPQPEYAPVDMTFGPLIATPSLSLEQGYDSNIFGLSVDIKGDGYSVLTPGLALRTNWGLHGLDLSAHAALSRYYTHSTQNSDEYGLHAGGHLDIGETVLSAAVDLGRTAERRRENGQPLTLGPPSTYTTATESLDVKRDSGRIALTAHSAHQIVDYADLVGIDGTVRSQGFRDQEVWTVDAGGSITPTSRLALGLGVSFAHAEARHVAGRSSDAVKLRAGAAIDLGLGRVELEAGYLDHRFVDPAFKDFRGLVYRGTASWFATPLITLTAGAGRSLDPSGDPTTGALLTTSWRIGADYELLRNLLLRGEAAWRKQRFRELGTAADSRKFEIRGEYSFNHSVAFAAYGRQQCRDSSETQAVSGRHWCATMIGLAISFRR